jgi:hypothetical protein
VLETSEIDEFSILFSSCKILVLCGLSISIEPFLRSATSRSHAKLAAALATLSLVCGSSSGDDDRYLSIGRSSIQKSAAPIDDTVKEDLLPEIEYAVDKLPHLERRLSLLKRLETCFKLKSHDLANSSFCSVVGYGFSAWSLSHARTVRQRSAQWARLVLGALGSRDF